MVAYRRFRPADEKGCRRVVLACVPGLTGMDDAARAYLRRKIAAAPYAKELGSAFCVVATDGERIVGLGALEGCVVSRMYVDPAYQGRGVGRELYRRLEGEAVRRGLDRLELEASLNAVGFYRALGYASRGEKTWTAGGAPVRNVLMSKVIERPPIPLPRATIHALTRGPKHHFFGYYGICPWSGRGDRLLCLESAFQDRLPAPGEPAAVGLVDGPSGAFEPVAETRAWNLQQGAMLHWHPRQPDTHVLYNDVQDGEAISVILDLRSGRARQLPRAVSALSSDGRYALSLTYGRLARLRKVVGYAGVRDPHPDDPHPDDDGVFRMDLETGACRLAVSIGQVYRLVAAAHPELRDRPMWFNHVVFNRSGSRFLFLARTRLPGGGPETGMYTANADGSDLREAIPYGSSVSHFDWRNDREIAATFRWDGPERRHVLFTDGRGDYRVLGEGFLHGDGHCTFSPDGAWLATDQNHPRAVAKSLRLLHVESGRGVELGRFDMREPRYLGGDLRCDLHPRWDRTGTAICFDAQEPHGGTRQLHVAELQGMAGTYGSRD